MRVLIAALACRNEGSRLYGKPLQNLDVENGYKILDNIVGCLRESQAICDVVLGVSMGSANQIFHEYTQSNQLRSVAGDEEDVLSRLIACGEASGATDIFRITSESPFPCYELIDSAWQTHLISGADATFLDNVIDGCNFEIIRMSALRTSHDQGEDRHLSELCTLYIRENKGEFKISFIDPPEYLNRRDLRLTVDYPEDLIVARAIYKEFREHAPRLPLRDIVYFLDENRFLVELIAPYCESGYETMYV